MSQVSKRNFSKKEREKFEKILTSVLINTSKKGVVGDFLKGFFTQTEQIMMSKRLVSQIMLVNGWSVLEVSRAMSMSDATVYKLQGYLDRDDKYNQMLKKYSNKLSRKKIKTDMSETGEFIDELVNIFVPTRHKKKNT